MKSAVKDRTANLSKVQAAAIANDLSIERRLPIAECEFETELLDVEPAGRPNIGNEDVGLRSYDDGGSVNRFGCCHRIDSFDQRRPTLETMLSRDKLLRIAELEVRFQDTLIVQIPESGEHQPDLRRNRVIPFTMPSQISFGALLQVFDIRHGRVLSVGPCCRRAMPLRLIGRRALLQHRIS